ncbi:MAG: hypothetical protein A2Z11_00295 [Candidatus Woykebacteria bacterium RBG_16_43_9]|uniref:LTD domain-containing protein n=1 Tax=Candidatus Woykebacteria bacterium RBG_16_43_9 TaxID=1802596 RepID=A0A1G1WG91_9BACT|nr:MAG: hypothetical protein A2Z11_00295 [Candidatus Woykebacteria bacterium RBG_16_43_9]
MKSSIFKIGLLFIIVGLLVISVKAKVSRSVFSDTETQTNNTISTATSFEPPTADHIVISEVQTTGGTGGGTSKLTDRDFIELYNPTNLAINLSGYRVVKRTGSGVPNDTNVFTFTSSHVIPAHGYFLWASSESPGFASSIGADVTSSETLASSNNSIALRLGPLNIGTIIDALSWNPAAFSLKEGTEFSPNPGINESMERKALSTSTALTMAIGGSDQFRGNGFDSNNNAADFVLRTLSQPQNSSSPIEIP